ncbi:MAG: nucleoside-diphosphate-sugar epimerase [Bradymonadia bacterium]|jgi:nucleoside-diphosphate-sugar epimerase
MAKRRKSPRTILVTGGTGFVGRHIVHALHERGDRVRVLVRETSNRAPIEGLYDEAFVGDLSDPSSLEGMCDGVDAVIHSACAVAGTFDSGRSALEAFMAVNRDGTRNVANEVLKHDGLRLVHISSTAAMGAPQTPIVDETSPCNPKAPYQRSKRAAELELLKLHENQSLNVVMIRPCVIAGPGKDNSELRKLFGMVKKGVFPLIGPADQAQKPLIHIDDLIQALILATEKGDAGSIYLVNSGASHTLGDILRVSGELAGVRRRYVRVPLRIARLAATVFSLASKVAPDWNAPLTHARINLFIADRKIDIGKAKRELGYEPTRTDVLEILEGTYRYHAEQGHL